jgi:mannitol-1-phosphate 5-dehydrogenase
VKPTFVQWGGGNIGRSFIGQVFSRSGYHVTFIDIDSKLVETLNEHKHYVVEAVSRDGLERLQVEDVSALHADWHEEVESAITDADLMGVSVGKNVWPHIARQLAHAILVRHKRRPDSPLDIILAENIHHGAAFVTQLLIPYLPKHFPLSSYVGLVETSIGKMVPIQKAHTPLVLRAEPYNELIVDKKGFHNPIPDVADLHPVHPIAAYVDRKLFIHNLGHATAAYIGFKAHPEQQSIAQVLEDPSVFMQVRKTMIQSMEILLHIYPKVFTRKELERHIDDLLMRFGNRALADTVFRVGRDLRRKLRYDDRLMGIIIRAQEIGMAWDRIGQAYLAAMEFIALDEEGNPFKSDVELIDELEGLPLYEAICLASSWSESDLPDQLCHTIAQACALIPRFTNGH